MEFKRKTVPFTYCSREEAVFIGIGIYLTFSSIKVIIILQAKTLRKLKNAVQIISYKG